ncbi:MAG: septal ring lytic transglycosylase RlpA family protein [Thermodesulfobacteriota bacterium]
MNNIKINSNMSLRFMLLKLIITLFFILSFQCVSFADDSNSGYSESGFASWYGKKLHGEKTASGKDFDMHSFTAAHRTLPFGTIVNVTNLNNGRVVKVVITDRGPFSKKRIIDLSRAAAVELGLLRKGVGKVKIDVE